MSVVMSVRAHICTLIRESIQERNPTCVRYALRASIGILLFSVMSPFTQERIYAGVLGMHRAPVISWL